YLDGKVSTGSLGGTAGTDQVSGISLTAGVAGTGTNFGELTPARLAGSVFADANNNGSQDTGEGGTSGVTVTLTGTDFLGSSVSRTATTDATGAYSFTNLYPGTYAITETQPSAYLDGKDSAGSAGGTAGSDKFTGIALGEGVNGTGYTFGEL